MGKKESLALERKIKKEIEKKMEGEQKEYEKKIETWNEVKKKKQEARLDANEAYLKKKEEEDQEKLTRKQQMIKKETLEHQNKRIMEKTTKEDTEYRFKVQNMKSKALLYGRVYKKMKDESIEGANWKELYSEYLEFKKEQRENEQKMLKTINLEHEPKPKGKKEFLDASKYIRTAFNDELVTKQLSEYKKQLEKKKQVKSPAEIQKIAANRSAEIEKMEKSVYYKKAELSFLVEKRKFKKEKTILKNQAKEKREKVRSYSQKIKQELPVKVSESLKKENQERIEQLLKKGNVHEMIEEKLKMAQEQQKKKKSYLEEKREKKDQQSASTNRRTTIVESVSPKGQRGSSKSFGSGVSAGEANEKKRKAKKSTEKLNESRRSLGRSRRSRLSGKSLDSGRSSPEPKPIRNSAKFPNYLEEIRKKKLFKRNSDDNGIQLDKILMNNRGNNKRNFKDLIIQTEVLEEAARRLELLEKVNFSEITKKKPDKYLKENPTPEDLYVNVIEAKLKLLDKL